jgi:hypothetical protein
MVDGAGLQDVNSPRRRSLARSGVHLRKRGLLTAGGRLEVAQQVAAHESSPTTGLLIGAAMT